jgi:hypothetical protein
MSTPIFMETIAAARALEPGLAVAEANADDIYSCPWCRKSFHFTDSGSLN